MFSSSRLAPLTVCIVIAACTTSSGSNRDPQEPSPAVVNINKALGKLRADDDMLTLLNTYSGLKPKAIEKTDVSAARDNPTMTDAVQALLVQQGRSTKATDLVPGITSQDISVQGAADMRPARVYTPAGSGPFPVVLYFHGGGFVIANKDVYDGGARGIAKAANAVVISVDYRLAPEHKFPAAWDDALASYKWTLANASRYHGDSQRIALAGESAGGNLALATAIAARDAQLQRPVHVLSIYPVTQTSRETESYLENAIAMPLNRAMMKWFLEHTIRTEADLKDTRLQLIDANLEDLPPTTIITARIDPLRSDGAKMADALEKAHVPVERRDFEGVTHEFFGTAAVVQKAKDAQAYAGERLSAQFESIPQGRTTSAR